MGIIERVKNIVSSNINHLLEKAENPEKMLKKMILDMEDWHRQMRAALFELNKERGWLENRLNENVGLLKKWDERARLAVEKGRDDLAREALASKRELEKSKSTLEGVLRKNKAQIEEIEANLSKLKLKIEEAKARHLEMSMQKLQAVQAQAGLADVLVDEKEEKFADIEIDEELRRLKDKLTGEKDAKGGSQVDGAG
jgi:phage shock protein A